MNQGDFPNFWMMAIQMAAMLCLVLALLYGLMFAIKRLSNRVQPQSDAVIDILCTRHIGPKKQVMLLEVQGIKILIGVGPETITGLACFPEDQGDFAGELEAQTQAAVESTLSEGGKPS